MWKIARVVALVACVSACGAGGGGARRGGGGPGCDEVCAALDGCGVSAGECRDACADFSAACRACVVDSARCGADCEATCTGGSGGAGGGGGGACDPGQCEDYCEWARCLWDGDIDGADCLRDCRANCGDGPFDDSDQSLIDCQAQVRNDFNCADSRACCEREFTNQICPD